MKITITENIRGSLFLSFAKIGLFTFGGGYAMISLIEAECVKKKNGNCLTIMCDNLFDFLIFY